MDIYELAGIEDRHALTWDECMTKVIQALGFWAVAPCIPYNKDKLARLYANDHDFNNTPLKVWDAAGGFEPDCGQLKRRKKDSALTALLRYKGVTRWSPSECVSILKHAAELWVTGGIPEACVQPPVSIREEA